MLGRNRATGAPVVVQNWHLMVILIARLLNRQYKERLNVAFLFINVNHDVGYESSESIPISLGYILAALKADGWNGVILDDLRDRPLTFAALEKWIRRIDPKVIGFTTYQSTMNRVRFLCRYIKSKHRSIQVALGGPQGALMPSRALEELEDVDALVRGDGEVIMPHMARVLAAGEGLEHVPGITCKCANRILDTGPPLDVPEDLDAYPSPYLTNILNLEGKNTAILLSSRGCRHVCHFCITPRLSGRKIRYHSVERVIAETELLASQGIERLWFADPSFTDDRERTRRLLDEKIHRGIKTPFWCQSRSDLVDADLLERLHAAGADTIAFGLESGSPSVLEKANKRIALEQLARNVEVAQSLGMATELFSIFGLPGETVEDARRTLDFVRSLGIPVESNSGSQQMQLYFGSTYEKGPERFGFKIADGSRPGYLSIGDHYETAALSRDEIRKVRNMWALANEQMKMDVYYKQRVFEILDFLLENRRDLEKEPELYAYGALTTAAIEEFDLLADFLAGYDEAKGPADASVEDLISSLGFFRETDGPAGPTDRIIFDSRSYMNGVPFAGISGKYWDVLLGRGLLLHSFEKGFIGASGGRELSFRFVFPDDYQQEELQGKEVEVQATIHKVLKSVEAHTLQDVRHLGIRNHYLFPELDVLREQNEILYYFALRDVDPASLIAAPSHFLMLTRMLAKLGKRDEIRRLGALVAGKPTALGAIADTLVGCRKFAWAVELYDLVEPRGSSYVLKKVRCLLNMEEYERAISLLENIPESPDLDFQETLLQCLSAAKPTSRRLPSLKHRVMDMRVQAMLGREALSKFGHALAPPLAHGYSEDSSRRF
jgi:anaerobic magnesium-protoporphyrin IX monomethyl ester cyclase